MKRFTGLLLLLLLAQPCAAQRKSHNAEVAKYLDIFNALYRDLDLYYVDTLDAKTNIDNAASYMLEMLDPYTEYYPEEETSSLRQMTTGKYDGIGSAIYYKKSEDRCIISEPYKGMPADEAGLLRGDVILSIAGHDIPVRGNTPTQDYTADVSAKLRGEAGTTFEIRVRRPTTGRVMTFNVTRRHITTPSVTLRKVLNDTIGYVHVTQFIENTATELQRAVSALKTEGARRLILDLRGNPGGLVEEAVKGVNLFVPRGREVVSMRGKIKESNSTFRTTTDPLDADMPLVVLVDSFSASASEIMSGALQDYDRAVVIGRRTYGKGLVQQSRDLPYKAMLKLTTGKYYIPSGRCVQAYSFKDGLPVHRPDSLSRLFRTASGRPVYDGGGITPDITVAPDSLPTLIAYLSTSDQLIDYCVKYRGRHATIASPSDFRLTDEEYADFCKFMKDNAFSYDPQSLRVLKTLRYVAHVEGYDTDAADELNALETKLKHDEDRDFRRWETEIRRVVEQRIIETYYYSLGGEEYSLRHDNALQRALHTISNPRLMQKILSGEPDA